MIVSQSANLILGRTLSALVVRVCVNRVLEEAESIIVEAASKPNLSAIAVCMLATSRGNSV